MECCSCSKVIGYIWVFCLGVGRILISDGDVIKVYVVGWVDEEVWR